MRLALLGSFALALLGCAHVHHETRVRRALLGTGGAAFFLGLLVTGGCKESATGCGGTPEDADLAAGLPLLVGGAALMGAGTLVPIVEPPVVKAPLPPPVVPDPTAPSQPPLWSAPLGR